MMNLKIKQNYIYILLIISLVSLDQYLKYFISSNFSKIINKNFIFFNIEFVKNYGAAFNIFSGSRIFLSSISIISSLLLIYLIFFKRKDQRINNYGLVLILSGSIGNGFDRIINGYVIDFINLNFVKFPVFNIADIVINIGFFILLLTYSKWR